MILPITLEKLEEHESDWLASGESDEYGAASFFIHRFYHDEEKAALAKRNGLSWKPGHRRPELV